MTSPWVFGIDIGGSGSRAALSDGTRTLTLTGERAHVAASGSSIPHDAAELLRVAAGRWPAEWAGLAAVGIGATGASTLIDDPAAVVATLAAMNPNARLALATDAVTTHLGALAGAGGAIVAVGTGSIGFATDFADNWRRVDGWGHLLGDRGAGAWIGIEGLRAAIRAHDGVDASGARLLLAAEESFGDPLAWPAQLYTRHDRAGVLAGFAPAVAAAAREGDPAARRIVREAGCHVAETLAAASVTGIPPVASTSGGVFAAGGDFAEAFSARFRELRPDVDLRPAAGTSLDGALRLARMLLAEHPATTRAHHLWTSQN